MRDEREKKKNRELQYPFYTVTVAILYMHSIIDRLMWVNFEQKCVKLYTFYFTSADVIALNIGHTQTSTAQR